MVRLINNVKLSDKKATSDLLKRVNMLSVNQINDQIQLTEIWKAVNNQECPLNITKMKEVAPDRPLRSKNITENKLLETGKSVNSIKTFINDGVKLWNKCPTSIRQCDTRRSKSFLVLYLYKCMDRSVIPLFLGT